MLPSEKNVRLSKVTLALKNGVRIARRDLHIFAERDPPGGVVLDDSGLRKDLGIEKRRPLELIVKAAPVPSPMGWVPPTTPAKIVVPVTSRIKSSVAVASKPSTVPWNVTFPPAVIRGVLRPRRH